MPSFNCKNARLRARRRAVIESRAADDHPDLAGVSLTVRVNADGAVVLSVFRSGTCTSTLTVGTNKRGVAVVRTDIGWLPVINLPDSDLVVVRALIYKAGLALAADLDAQDPITTHITAMEAANDYV